MTRRKLLACAFCCFLVLAHGAVVPAGTRTESEPLGDTTGDGRTDTQDAVELLDYQLRNKECSRCEDKGDVNGDGFVDLQDVASILGISTLLPDLGEPDPPQPQPELGKVGDVDIDESLGKVNDVFKLFPPDIVYVWGPDNAIYTMFANGSNQTDLGVSGTRPAMSPDGSRGSLLRRTVTSTS